MTIPIERTAAVNNARRFLYDLLDPSKTPGVPKSIRQQASSLIKHYPTGVEMDIISEREDQAQQRPVIFGNNFFMK